MSFEKLLADLDELQRLQKSAPVDAPLAKDEGKDEDGDQDDADIAAAADDDGDGDEDDGTGVDTDGDGDEPMGKSFRFTNDDGDELEAVDGTELVKSLMGRVEAQEDSMTKALGVAVDLIKSQGDLIKSQGEAIAALQAKVGQLSTEGRGRKTVVSVAEKPAAQMAKSQPSGVSSDEFMAKALSAQQAGRITGLQVSIAEGYLQRGQAVPADIVQKVLA